MAAQDNNNQNQEQFPQNDPNMVEGSAPPPPIPTDTQSPQLVSPQDEPQPNMPPPNLTEQQQQDSKPHQAPAPPSQPTQTVTPKRGGIPKKLIFGLLGLLLLGGIAAAIVMFVLPNLGVSLPGGKTELTWWGLWEDDGIVTPLIDEYQQQNPGVTIKYVRQSKEDYRERLADAIAQGKAPDIFRIHNTWVPMFSKALATIPNDVMTQQEYENTFYPVALDDFGTTKGIVGIPLMYDGLGLFINEDIFSTFGATVPKTWSELRDTAKFLTIKDNNDFIKQSGVALGITSNVDHWPEIIALMMIQNGADPAKPTGEAADVAIRFYNQFNSTDKVWDDTLPNSTIAFATGQLAMYFGPSWRAFEIMDQNPSLKFKVVSVPQLPKTDSQLTDITYASYWAESVWDGSENKEEAWKFLKFLSSKESLQKLYNNAANGRDFGEIYPRQDMRDSLLSDPITGGFVELAPTAKSWYLASRTFDGQTGINTSLANYYADAINLEKRGSSQDYLNTLSSGVQSVLARYGLAAPLPTPAK